MKDLGEILGPEAVVGQALHEKRQTGRVLYLRRDGGAVEVGTQSDMLDADALGDIGNMADEKIKAGVRVLHAIVAQEQHAEIDADQSARVADRVDLPVGQVAAVRAKRMHVGMRSDKRRLGKRGDIPEALLVHMREIDHDPQLVAGAYEVLARLGQAGPDIGRGRETERHAVSEDVGPAPDGAEGPKAGLMQNV